MADFEMSIEIDPTDWDAYRERYSPRRRPNLIYKDIPDDNITVERGVGFTQEVICLASI